MSEVDTSAEAVERAANLVSHTFHSSCIEREWAGIMLALLSERDTLRQALSQARNDALEEAAKVCTGDEDRPELISASRLRRMSSQEQFAYEQLRLAWKDADEIRKLKSQEAE